MSIVEGGHVVALLVGILTIVLDMIEDEASLHEAVTELIRDANDGR